MSIKEHVREQLPDGSVVFDNPSFDKSIIGTTTDGRIVYCYEKMVAELMADEELNMQEAIDYIEVNTIRMLPYLEHPPVIMYERTWAP